MNEGMEETFLDKRVLNMGSRIIANHVNTENLYNIRLSGSRYEAKCGRTLKHIGLRVYINL
jgi:hypothetical protein